MHRAIRSARSSTPQVKDIIKEVDYISENSKEVIFKTVNATFSDATKPSRDLTGNIPDNATKVY